MSEISMRQRICSEERREKSRNAARHRRSIESELFLELAQQLPLPQSITAHLDKASVMRLAISYVHLKNVISTDQKNTDTADASQIKLILDALEGFVMVVSQTGEMLFLSENVSKHLGLAQVDVIGQSLFDYIHPCDEEEIREVLHFKHEISTKKVLSTCNFFTRMKCTWASRERSPNLKPASWKVLHCTGQAKLVPDTAGSPCRCLVLLCEPILFPCQPVEGPIANTFLSRHELDMKFTHCDDRVEELLGYSRTELQGRSVYDYYHALDTDLIKKSHQNLLSKGQSSTGQYRLLSKHGGYVWAQTDATLVYSGRNFQPESVICMNYILSEPVETNVVFSLEQTECFFKPWDLPSSEDPSPVDERDVLFTKLREHPEELAQLAPTPGDTIVMLDFDVDEMPPMEFPREFDPQEETLAPGSAHATSIFMESFSMEAPWPAFPLTPPPSCPTDTEAASEGCYQQDGGTFPMEYTEKLLATQGELQTGSCSQSNFQNSDLEMLAPYIPMEGDFELMPIGEVHLSLGSTKHALDMPAYDTGGYQSLENSSPQGYFQPAKERHLTPLERELMVNQEVMYGRPENGKIAPSWHTYQGHSHFFDGCPNVPWPPDYPFSGSLSGALYVDWPPALGQKPQTNMWFPPAVTEGVGGVWKTLRGNTFSTGRSQPVSLKRKQDMEFSAQSQAWEPLPEKIRIAVEPLSAFKKGIRWYSRPSWDPPEVSKAYGVPGWQSPRNLGNTSAPGLGRHLLGAPSTFSALPVLSSLDCEVNAPLQGQCRLLQGYDLLRVLGQGAAGIPLSACHLHS